MRTLRRTFVKLAGWFRTSRRERELRDELESHLLLHFNDNLRQGMSHREARRVALLKLGGVESVKDTMRDVSTFVWMETVWQDVRYALRGLGRSPNFTVTALLSLALGIGGSVAIFTVADNLLLRPLPYPDPSRLMVLWEETTNGTFTRGIVSPANYLDWRARSDVLASSGAFNEGRAVLSDGARIEELARHLVSGDFQQMLGVQPVRGRLFTAAEDRPGQATALIISHRIWQTWFAGDEQVLGRRVQINSTPRTIVGVMPAGFYFLNREVDLWEPLGLNPANNYRKTDGRYMLAAARLKPDVSVAAAQAQLTAIARQLAVEYPSFNEGFTVRVESLRDAMLKESKTSLLILLGAVGLLLAVACANVANLLLARFTARQREIAVRASLGAGRARVVRQMLTESIVLGVAGGVLGLVFARWAVSALVRLAPKDMTRTVEVQFDLRIVALALALSVLTGIVFGLAPVWMTWRTSLTQALHQSTRTSVGGRHRLRRWLVAAEVALSVILLTGAGLLFRSLVGLQAVPSGLDPSNVLTFRVSLPNARYKEPAKRRQFIERAIERLEQLPDVRSAGAISHLPFGGIIPRSLVTFDSGADVKRDEKLMAAMLTVVPGYFETFRIPLKRGRDFTAADNIESAPHRFVVNEAFVRTYSADREPIGRLISCWMDAKNPFGEIVGVVGDVKTDALDKPTMPTVYYNHAHLTYNSMLLVVHTAGDPLALAEPARRAIRELDPLQPIAMVRTMDEVVGETMARQRFSTVLLSAFSVAALLLAAIGVYGVLAYAVSERTREIGLRMALGAERRGIVSLVVGAGLRLVLAGTIVGAAGALALSGLLRNLLYGIGPRDPLTFVAVPAVLVAVALAAAYVPARRAARLDPMNALRTD